MANKYSKRVVDAAESLVRWASVEEVQDQLKAAGSKNVALDMKSALSYLANHDGSSGDAQFEILIDRLRLIGKDAYDGDELKITFDTIQCELRVRGYFEEAKDRAKARRKPDAKGEPNEPPKPAQADNEFARFLAERAAQK